MPENLRYDLLETVTGFSGTSIIIVLIQKYEMGQGLIFLASYSNITKHNGSQPRDSMHLHNIL